MIRIKYSQVVVLSFAWWADFLTIRAGGLVVEGTVIDMEGSSPRVFQCLKREGGKLKRERWKKKDKTRKLKRERKKSKLQERRSDRCPVDQNIMYANEGWQAYRITVLFPPSRPSIGQTLFLSLSLLLLPDLCSRLSPRLLLRVPRNRFRKNILYKQKQIKIVILLYVNRRGDCARIMIMPHRAPHPLGLSFVSPPRLLVLQFCLLFFV